MCANERFSTLFTKKRTEADYLKLASFLRKEQEIIYQCDVKGTKMEQNVIRMPDDYKERQRIKNVKEYQRKFFKNLKKHKKSKNRK